MVNRDILKLLSGFKKFREKYFTEDESLALKYFETQSPKTLIIACSDSRVDPALISSASPGELFVVRNVANLVPPYETALQGRHGVSAAIEFAILQLKVQNVIVLGHRQCGGIRALMENDMKTPDSFVTSWMSIAEPAKDRVLEALPFADLETQCRSCEQESIAISLENLKTFPFIQKALENNALNLYGIYFDLEQGILTEFNEEQNNFTPIVWGQNQNLSEGDKNI